MLKPMPRAERPSVQPSVQPAAQPAEPVAAGVVAAGLRAFFRIAERWALSNEEAIVLLGQPSRATYFKWKKGEVGSGRPGLDLATRLSLVLGVFKALELLYRQPEQADRWLRQPNAAFAGQSALERMLAGQITDLAAVRDYLDSVRGGW